MHWAAYKKNIHEYLDDFLGVLGDYQDRLSEIYMGINGQLNPMDMTGIQCSCTNLIEFIKTIEEKTIKFYEGLPKETRYASIVSDCETFLGDIQKYMYLFSLCDIK